MLLLRVDNLPTTGDCDMQLDLNVLPVLLSAKFDVAASLLEWMEDVQAKQLVWPEQLASRGGEVVRGANLAIRIIVRPKESDQLRGSLEHGGRRAGSATLSECRHCRGLAFTRSAGRFLTFCRF